MANVATVCQRLVVLCKERLGDPRQSGVDIIYGSRKNSLSQWLNFKLSGITCLVGKIKFKLFSSGSRTAE